MLQSFLKVDDTKALRDFVQGHVDDPETVVKLIRMTRHLLHEKYNRPDTLDDRVSQAAEFMLSFWTDSQLEWSFQAGLSRAQRVSRFEKDTCMMNMAYHHLAKECMRPAVVRGEIDQARRLGLDNLFAILTRESRISKLIKSLQEKCK